MANGHNVTIMDDLSNSTREQVPSAATLIVQDVTVPGALDDIVTKVDGIFHLAAVVSVVKSNEEWLQTHQVTLGGTVAVLDTLARLKRHIPVVYASSAAVYGDAVGVPFKENGQCAPISAYGADKLACELHARVGQRVHGIPSVGLRFFNVYGQGQDPQSPYAGVISIFAEHMQQHQPVMIYGDGEQTRDYIDVADVVSAMLVAMNRLESKALFSGVFNVCTGMPVSVNALAQMIAKLTASRSQIVHADNRPGDIRISLGDPASANQLLGFRAKTQLNAGLEILLKSV